MHRTRFTFWFGLLSLLTGGLRAQPSPGDSLRVNRLIDLSDAVRIINSGRSLQLGEEALTLARNVHYPAGEAQALLAVGAAHVEHEDYLPAINCLNQARRRFDQLHNRVGLARVMGLTSYIYTHQGNYVPALSLGLQALSMAKELGDSLLIRRQTARLGSLYVLLGDYQQGAAYETTALAQWTQANYSIGVCQSLNGLGEICRLEGNLPKAIRYYNKAIRLARSLKNARLEAETQSNLAAVEVKQGRYRAALQTAHQALGILTTRGEYGVIAWTQVVLARAYLGLNRADSAVFFGRQAWTLSRRIGYKEAMREACDVLAQAYARRTDFAQAYTFQRAYTAYNDTLSGRQTQQQLAVLQHDAALAEQQAAATLQAEEAGRQQQRLLSALAGLALLGVVAVVLWRSNRRQQQANVRLRQQQAEIQAAQTQLIQREKMASLGELTAGIAHEIQNPLNFVNNFAEVCVELVDELDEEVNAGHTNEVLPLTGDLRQNLTKIHHHGKRADAIVKAMLQHSRVSTGQRQPTDLNALADEYLRLSYHGLRAKEKDVQATLLTRFDPGLGRVDVVVQDISRVLLNLFNNAFYAVTAKKKRLTGAVSTGVPATADYQPQVSVTTRRAGETIEIRVRDNGDGIPDAVLTKIYQPFFTTKPAGEGTGLGLSLSYDIITKGHGGTLTVATQAGEFAEFTITLAARP